MMMMMIPMGEDRQVGQRSDGMMMMMMLMMGWVHLSDQQHLDSVMGESERFRHNVIVKIKQGCGGVYTFYI